VSRPLIFIADLLHALDALRIDSPEHARAVMRMLSLESWTELAAPRPEPLRSAAPPAPPAPEPDTAAGPLKTASATAPGVVADSAAAEPTRAAVTPLASAPATIARPGWAASAAAMPRAGATTSPPPEPLLDPQQERAIVASLAAGLVDDDSLDIDSLVVALSRAEPLRRLPMRRSWGLRRGVQVLVDQGPGMAPFAADVEQFIARLSQLLPPDRLQRAGFEGSPLRAVRIPKRKRAPWQPPEPDTAVLVISDLGLCSGEESLHAAGTAEWLELAEVAHRARVLLRTLVPYPPSRWPAALCGPLRCIHWDRRTTAATARRTLAGIE
jgi:hypothetical protein